MPCVGTVPPVALGVTALAVYEPGDVRWVKGGTAYGSESAGPDGCEFYIVSLGPFDVCDPETNPPPNGHWSDVLGA